VVVCALAALQPPAARAADPAEATYGTFWLDDGDSGDRWELVLRDAVAYRTVEEDFDMALVSIVLASQPVNRERMRAELDGEDGWWHTHGPHVKVDVCDREGEWAACGLHVQLGGKSISGTADGKDFVDSLVVSEDRVQLRLATPEPLTFFRDRYGLEAAVDLPIESFE
jgi:hypothetical protein